MGFMKLFCSLDSRKVNESREAGGLQSFCRIGYAHRHHKSSKTLLDRPYI